MWLQGKSAPNLHLEWKKEEKQEEEDEYRLSVQRYMGVVKSVRRVRKLQGHMNGVVCIHFDKKRLISAGLDRCIRLWDVRSGQSIHKFYGHKVPSTNLFFGPFSFEFFFFFFFQNFSGILPFKRNEC